MSKFANWITAAPVVVQFTQPSWKGVPGKVKASFMTLLERSNWWLDADGVADGRAGVVRLGIVVRFTPALGEANWRDWRSRRTFAWERRVYGFVGGVS